MIKFLLEIYMFPVKINSRIKHYVQEVILLDTVGHLSKPIHFLKIKKLLGKNPVIIDIGGANGDTTDFFLNALPLCRVFTFEAIPELASQINKRFVNQNVQSYALALSDKEGSVTFHVTDNFLSSSYKTINENKQFHTLKSIEVPSSPLDYVMENVKDVFEIDILKLDVQGAELDVLRGALLTMKKTKLIIVEQSVRSAYSGGPVYYEVDEFLRHAGFELLDIIITYRKDGLVLTEYDSIYLNKKYNIKLS